MAIQTVGTAPSQSLGYWVQASTAWVQPVRNLKIKGGGHWRPVAETWGVKPRWPLGMIPVVPVVPVPGTWRLGFGICGPEK